MDPVRDAVDATVRRLALLGLLASAAVVAALGHHPRAAMDAAAILLGVEAVALWQLGEAAPRLPWSRAFARLPQAPADDRRRRRMLADLMAERFRAWAGRMAIPAALAAAIDLASRVWHH